MTTQNTTTLPTAPGGGPLDPLGADLNKTLRTLKLGGLKDTLPERLTLARQRNMGHAAEVVPDLVELEVAVPRLTLILR